MWSTHEQAIKNTDLAGRDHMLESIAPPSVRVSWMPLTPPSLLVISRGGHPGIDYSLKHLTAVGTLRASNHIVIPLGMRREEAESQWSRVAHAVWKSAIELVILYHYHAEGLADPRPLFEKLRTQGQQPIIAFCGGDPFFNGFFRPRHPDLFRNICREADLTFNTSMGVAADSILQYGARRVALMPHGACPARFPLREDAYEPAAAEFDVCFIGSNNISRNPTRSYLWFGLERRRLVSLLSRRFGSRFGLFGHGWEKFNVARAGSLRYAN